LRCCRYRVTGRGRVVRRSRPARSRFSASQAFIEVPKDLIPEVRKLIARHRAS